jgi:hypothetical protein
MTRFYNFKGAILLLFLMVFTLSVQAQKKWFETSANDAFLKKQWWIGVRGGLNISMATPGTRFSTTASTTDPTTTEYQKQYENFSVPGGQGGLEFMFSFYRFSISFQPSFQRQSFIYNNSHSWSDAGGNNLKERVQSLQKLDYFEFPLLLKYQPFNTKLKPFIQAGAYYGLLDNAYKSTKIYLTDVPSGSNSEYLSNQINIGDNSLFITSSWGLIGGIGAYYPVGNIRLVMDVSFRFGMNNITSAANRYSNGLLSGPGDIMDNIKLRNLSLSFGVLFPLKFLKASTYWAE